MRPVMLLLAPALAALPLLAPLPAHAGDAWLGVVLQELDDTLRDALELDEREGVLVSDVEAKSPAESAGLEDGDVILAIGDVRATSSSRVARAIGRADPGEEMTLLVVRDGERLTLTATLTERDERRARRLGRGRRFGTPRAPGVPRLRHLARPHREGVEAFGYLFGRPRLGVETRALDDDLAPYFEIEPGGGVLVVDVMADTPAEDAGLRGGDVIVRVDSEPIRSPGELRDVLLDFEGETVTIELKRRGEDVTVEVTLDEPVISGGSRAGRASVFALPDDPGLREEMEALREELDALREELEALRDAR